MRHCSLWLFKWIKIYIFTELWPVWALTHTWNPRMSLECFWCRFGWKWEQGFNNSKLHLGTHWFETKLPFKWTLYLSAIKIAQPTNLSVRGKQRKCIGSFEIKSPAADPWEVLMASRWSCVQFPLARCLGLSSRIVLYVEWGTMEIALGLTKGLPLKSENSSQRCGL